MITIGILYICTGRYSIFWKDFFLSCEKYFIPSVSKRYFVFTDCESLEFSSNNNVTIISQNKLGWPYDTLKRFDIFLRSEAVISNTDYLFFFNANAVIAGDISEDILPEIEGLVGVKHPCQYNLKPGAFIYERDPRSLAYIPFGDGEHYFMGSFNGGTTSDYLTMCRVLKNNIEQDEQKGIIALWWDESHLNRYFVDHAVKVLSPSFAYPEELQIPFMAKIVLRDKMRFGGHDFLRGLQKESIPEAEGVSHSGSSLNPGRRPPPPTGL